MDTAAGSRLASAEVGSSGLQERPGQAHKHIGALDGIRGLAVLMVFASHYGDFAQNTHSTLLLTAERVKEAGWLGVDLFFALSGYLITGILWKTRKNTNKVRSFYAKRVLRLFPVYYAVWIFLVGYSAVTSRNWEPHVFLEYIFYLGNFAAPYHMNVGPFLVSHFWSLAVEEQFYLIWPFIIWKMSDIRAVLRLLVALFATSTAIKIGCLIFGVYIHAYFYLPTHMEALTAGAFTSLAIIEWPDLCQRFAKLALAILIPSLLIAFICFDGFNNEKLSVVTATLPMIGIIAASLILRAQDHDSLLAKLMNLRILKFYGKISYGFYVYHVLFRDIFKHFLYPTIYHLVPDSFIAKVLYLPLVFMICTLIATASFYFYEKPFLQMKRRFEGARACP
jgi:peptidoglycan/LPS O-acetylase OafA/YrhL